MNKKIIGMLFFVFASIHLHAEIQSPLGEEEFVNVADANLFCRIYGKGKPILVIHGGPGLSQDYLLPQMSRLAKNNLVIFYDQRACGRSTVNITSAKINLETYLNDIEAIRKHFAIKKISILGHSWGGFLGMNYAIAHPEAIDKLILANSAPASFEEYQLFAHEYAKRISPIQKELSIIENSSNFLKRDPEAMQKYLQLVFSTYCYDPEKVNLLNLTMSTKASVNFMKVNEIFNQNLLSKPFNLHENLKKLNIPTLIVIGDTDVIPMSTSESIHKSIRDSKLVVIKDCGHFPYVEQHDIFFQTIEDFLK